MLLLELSGLIFFYERWLVSWIRGRTNAAPPSDGCR